MGHAADVTRVIIIIFKYFAFSNFSINVLPVLLSMHVVLSKLVCGFVCWELFWSLVSRISFLCKIKSCNSNDFPRRLIPVGPWIRAPLGPAAWTAIWPNSLRLVGGHSCLSFWRCEWYATAVPDPSRIGSHPLNEDCLVFQASVDRSYEIETGTFQWSKPRSKSRFADTSDDCKDLECKM